MRPTPDSRSARVPSRRPSRREAAERLRYLADEVRLSMEQHRAERTAEALEVLADVLVADTQPGHGAVRTTDADEARLLQQASRWQHG